MSKWISKYDLGDRLRHLSDMSVHGIVIGINFRMGSDHPIYVVSSGETEYNWYQEECVRIMSAKIK